MSYIGLSSFPRDTSPDDPFTTDVIDEVITVMNIEGSTAWRMTYKPHDARFPWDEQLDFIQYYLDHCPYELIVDYYHTTGVVLTETQWQESLTRGLAIMERFKLYGNRVLIEPQNEQLQGTLPDLIIPRSQELVTAARDAGYTHKIVSNVFWRTPLEDMIQVVDPLDRFYSGQHIYFFTKGVQKVLMSQAKAIMQKGLDAGVKIINTEIGADSAGQNYFTEFMVGMDNEFMQWGVDDGRNIGNNLWTMYGIHDYPKYKELGLEFPTGGESKIAKITNTGTADLKITQLVPLVTILKPGETKELEGNYTVECE